MLPTCSFRCLAILLSGVLVSAWLASAKADSELSPTELRRQAERLDKANRWTEAADVYVRLVRLQPDQSEWLTRLRRCFRQEQITRRYQDKSFQKQVLGLTLEKALQHLREVFAKIDTNYVEEVKPERLLAHGFQSLELALQNRAFLRLFPKEVQGKLASHVREVIHHHSRELAGSDRAQSLRKAQDFALEVEREIGVPAAVIVAELACAACEALDECSSYIPPARFAELQALTDGEIAGVGVELALIGNQLIVSRLVADGPAARAGVHVRDSILRIDDTPTSQLNLEQAALRLLGKEGSRVSLTIQGPVDMQPRRIELVRQAAALPSILDSRMVDGDAGVGYIQIGLFQKSTPEELDAAVTKLLQQGLETLILDLRGNPGGSLTAAVQVADRFLVSGTIVSTRGRSPGSTAVYRTENDADWSVPLVVLIDNESASASEILAGAIKEHRRGTLVGQRSYGKASVQHVFPLRTVAAGIRLTTARFYSPSDASYSEQGVTPDVVVERLPTGMDPMTMSDPQFQAAVQLAKQLVDKRQWMLP